MKQKNVHDIPITIIASVDLAMGIGKDNELLCRLSSDMKRFKEITTGHTVIMGLNTWLSLPVKPLPNRRHIVIAPEKVFEHPDVIFVQTIDEALKNMEKNKENFIIGGAMVYSTFIEYAQKILLTVFMKTFPADAFFPEISASIWEMVEESETFFDEKNQMQYVYRKYIRK